jgi:alkylation response protein AidB-like acyl-CoA dehydrogenase
MIGFTPSEEQEQLKETARGFAERHVRPLVERVRHEGAPSDPWPLVKPVFEEGAKLGFTKLFLPEELGGMGGSCLDAALLLE